MEQGKEYRHQATMEKGREYRPQKKAPEKEKGDLGEKKLKSHPLRSRFPSKTESWKKEIAVFFYHQSDRLMSEFLLRNELPIFNYQF